MKNKLLISRAQRNLRRLANFRLLEAGEPDFSDWALQYPFDYGETLIGAYENTPGRPEDGILITTRGLHVFRPKGVDFISYHQIERVEPLDEAAETSMQVTLQIDGRRRTIPVRGRRGQHSDASGFAYFLNQMIQDLREL